MDAPWPKGLSGARGGSLVKRNLYIGEFGLLFIPDRIGVITNIEEIDGTMIYDVLFFIGIDGRDGELHTLRLFDEDLMLITL